MITFPELGIELKLSPIAISILGIDIYWYAILIVGAIILSLFILKQTTKKSEIKYENILELAVYVLPIGFISARLYYVLFNMDYYYRNPIQIFNLKSGGLAIYGGIIGGAITTYIYCKKKQINCMNLLDQIVPVLALSQGIGRWGNFFNIEAYGIETNSILRMRIMENGIYKEVIPTFLYESIADLIIFVILMILNKKRQKTGETTLVYLILYSFVRFFIEEIRIDSLMLYNIKISQLLSLLIFAVSCSILSYKTVKCRKIIKNIKK